MPRSKYKVIFGRKGITYVLCKIIFGTDGSYYVTIPYHSAHKGLFFKYTANYTQSIQSAYGFSPMTEIGVSDETIIKLSHHPDGFVQFSGKGLISGKDANGNIKGIGVMSWPLTHPVPGPAFTIRVWGMEDFEKDEVMSRSSQDIQTEEGAIGGEEYALDFKAKGTQADIVMIEGHYFHPGARRFVQTLAVDQQIIFIVHPSGIIMPLRVLMAPNSCAIPGFIGLAMWGEHKRDDFPETNPKSPNTVYQEKSGYSISSCTGNIRLDGNGDKLGDGICCVYPSIEYVEVRNLNFTPEIYELNDRRGH